MKGSSERRDAWARMDGLRNAAGFAGEAIQFPDIVVSAFPWFSLFIFS
jgi:hypothetical protein